MPSSVKIIHFLSSAFATSASIGILSYGMSRQWARTTMDCTSEGGSFSNGSAVVTLALFRGNMVRSFCPVFGGSIPDFEVIPRLMKIGEAPAALHTVVVCLLSLCLLCSACSLLLGLYNSVSNPYETFMGPIGVYVCSSLSAFLSVLVMVLFAANLLATDMGELLVENIANAQVDVRNQSSQMLLGFFLVIPYTVLSLGSIVCIYLYEHAAYKHRREQQRPTEDAPKEIMMY